MGEFSGKGDRRSRVWLQASVTALQSASARGRITYAYDNTERCG